MKENTCGVLIDTSAWIEFLRPQGDTQIGERVQDHLRQGRACCTEMVLLELWNGARGPEEKQFLIELQAVLMALSTGEPVWREAYWLAQACRQTGYTIPATDILIYAVANVHKVDLDHNDRHFDRIGEVAKLQL